MLLFSIPDIRLFWSRDKRFLSQFSASDGPVARFVPFSKHPACYKDVSFWLPSSSGGGITSGAAAVGGGGGGAGGDGATAWAFHENDVMEVVREVTGDEVEDVYLVDEFTHPGTGRRSVCYRINDRSFERTLTNRAANGMHDVVKRRLVEVLGVELR